MAVSTRRTNSCFACQKSFIYMHVDKTRCQPALGLPDPGRPIFSQCVLEMPRQLGWALLSLYVRILIPFWSADQRSRKEPTGRHVRLCPSASDCSPLAAFLSPKRSAPAAPIHWSPTFGPWDGPGSRTPAPHRPPTRPSRSIILEFRPEILPSPPQTLQILCAEVLKRSTSSRIRSGTSASTLLCASSRSALWDKSSDRAG
jgi:hypothetical protein